MKITQSDGSEVEVFTQQEVEQKVRAEKEAALQEYKNSNPDKSAEIDKLIADLAEANRKLAEAEAGGNPDQIQRLKQARDEAQKQKDDEVKRLSKDLEDFKNDTVKEVKDDLMARFTKGDSDLEKKIQYEFDRYRTNENTKQAIRERMEKAFQLATGNRPIPTAFDSFGGAAGNRGTGHAPVQSGEISENARKIGNAFGISDEQRTRANEFLKQHKEKQNN